LESGSGSEFTAREFVKWHPERFFAKGDWEPPPGELHLVFSPKAIKRMRGRAVVVAKKAALYGTRSYFLTRYRASQYFLPGEEDSSGTPPTVYSFDDAFVDFVQELFPYVVDGCIAVIPSWDVGGAVGNNPYTVTNKGLLKIELEKKFLLKQLTESPKAVSLFLPYIAGIPSVRLLEIRHEYQDKLTDFHRALYGLVSSPAEQGERILYELMQEVDHNIRRLNDQMDRLSKKQWFERMKLGLVGFPMILAFAVPPDLQEIVKTAAEMVGSASALSYVESLRTTSVARRDIEQSPFYVPWLLQQPKLLAHSPGPHAKRPGFKVSRLRRWTRKLPY
jgi:hypothetical protein